VIRSAKSGPLAFDVREVERVTRFDSTWIARFGPERRTKELSRTRRLGCHRSMSALEKSVAMRAITTRVMLPGRSAARVTNPGDGNRFWIVSLSDYSVGRKCPVRRHPGAGTDGDPSAGLFLYRDAPGVAEDSLPQTQERRGDSARIGYGIRNPCKIDRNQNRKQRNDPGGVESF